MKYIFFTTLFALGFLKAFEPLARAESAVKKEAQEFTGTIKRDHKKIAKQTKSEAKSAFGAFKSVFKKTKKDLATK